MPALVWTETFESYTPGNDTISSPWSGPTNTIISTAIFHAGTQSFGSGRGGNASTTTRALGSALNQWIVDGWFYSVSGNTVNDPPVINSPIVRMYKVSSGGSVTFLLGGSGTYNLGVNGGAVWFTGSISLNTWHHFVWATTMASSGTSSLAIDGGAPATFSGDTRNDGLDTSADQINLIGQSVVGSSVEVYVDDLSIYSGVPAAGAAPFFHGPFGAVKPGLLAVAAGAGLVRRNPLIRRRSLILPAAYR